MMGLCGWFVYGLARDAQTSCRFLGVRKLSVDDEEEP